MEQKKSYTITCASDFRDAVLEMAAKKGMNSGDIARSVFTLIPSEVIKKHQDPGEPMGKDREPVTLKSGKAAGKTWNRKPRLQVRMAPGYDNITIRKALSLALEQQRQKNSYFNIEPNNPKNRPGFQNPDMEIKTQIRSLKDEIEEIRSAFTCVSFKPLPEGIKNRTDALHVMGFAPSENPDMHTIKSRFRMMATIYHPDGKFGDHERMAQINDAAKFLMTKSIF